MESPVELMIQVVNVEPKGVLTQTVNQNQNFTNTMLCDRGISPGKEKKRYIQNLVSCKIHKSFQVVQGEWFDEIFVDAGCVSLMLETGGGNSSNSHDAGWCEACCTFIFANFARGDKAVHNRH